MFSKDADFHFQLLSQFTDLTKQFGVMLSQKKMVIRVFEIDLWGMHNKDGQYSGQAHVCHEFLKFSDIDLSKREV